MITLLEGRKLNCTSTTLSNQKQQVRVVIAPGYKVKNWTFCQYPFSEISNILSENTIVMDCPFLYFDIHSSERDVFVFDDAFYC